MLRAGSSAAPAASKEPARERQAGSPTGKGTWNWPAGSESSAPQNSGAKKGGSVFGGDLIALALFGDSNWMNVFFTGGSALGPSNGQGNSGGRRAERDLVPPFEGERSAKKASSAAGRPSFSCTVGKRLGVGFEMRGARFSLLALKCWDAGECKEDARVDGDDWDERQVSGSMRAGVHMAFPWPTGEVHSSYSCAFADTGDLVHSAPQAAHRRGGGVSSREFSILP
mmetsp:Transcript_20733/g.48471  ORF Transcript_20733/g.48471 Transcript_20733/m.48471 type:complete len:226 (-) Transcript_20733:47-724(-)